MEKSLPSIDELKIQDLLLKPDEVTEYPQEMVFEVKLDGVIKGTIERTSLQNFLEQGIESDVEIKDLASDEWVPANLHPLFQRRKPQILKDASIDHAGEELYLLRNGERSGPFEKKQIIEMLDNKEICVTDMISVNGRDGWQKLYEYQEFDRRTHGELPHLPHLQAPPKKLFDDDPELAEIEAMVGLAYVSNIKSGMQEGQYKESKPQDNKKAEAPVFELNPQSSGFNFKKPLLLVLGIILALGSYIFIANIPTKHGPKVTTTKVKSYRPAKKQAKVHRLKPQRRKIAAKPRIKPSVAKVKNRSSVPFKESAVYKKYKEQREESIGEPLELEPEEMDQEYPVDEVNLDDDLDDVSEEEVQEFVKSIHGGFSIRSNDEFDEEGPESEKELFEEELSY